MSESTKTIYGADFFARQVETSTESAQRVVPIILEWTNCRSVLDVGCGAGAWLAAFAECGVADFLGIDGDYVPRERLCIPAERFCAVDLNRGFEVGRRFDLATCLEVGEHLPAESAEVLVNCLTKAADVVLFSAAIPGQNGLNHVNEQWPAYWALLFEKQGFVARDALRRRIWDDEKIAWWYAQNSVFYVAKSRLKDYPHLAAAAGDTWALVHPRLLEISCAERDKAGDLGLRKIGELVGALPPAVKKSIRYRLGLRE